MLLHQLILLVSPIRYQTHLLPRKEGKILVHWRVHYNILINSITHSPWEDLSQLVKIFPMPSCNAECLLQYSQKSTWCWGVESTPQCHPISSTLWSVSSCPDRGIQKGPSHLLFVQITFYHFSLNILYSSPCTLNPLNAELNPICHLLALFVAHHILHVSRIRVKWLPLPAKCLPNHPHNHHTVLICGFVISLQHETSYCGTIFLLLTEVLCIYLNPSFHQHGCFLLLLCCPEVLAQLGTWVSLCCI
jgi:hypothetical protein